MCTRATALIFSYVLLVLLWADQLSSLSVVDIRPCCTVEPWPSSIIFTFMVDPGSQPISSSSPPATVVSSPGNARSTRSQSVQSGESELPEHSVRELPPPHPEQRHRSRSRRRRRRHHRRHDDEQFEAPRPRSAPGIMPPRPRPSMVPSIGPTARPTSLVPSSAMSPERPPGCWQPQAASTPSPRPAMPRPRPPPDLSRAEDPLQRAAEMFRNPASAAAGGNSR